MKDKKGITITNAFHKILDEFNRKSNKIWVDKDSGFCNRPMISFLHDNNKAMCSIHNEEKSVVAERFIRTLQNKIHKYMSSISKNKYIDDLDGIVNTFLHLTQRINGKKIMVLGLFVKSHFLWEIW